MKTWKVSNSQFAFVFISSTTNSRLILADKAKWREKERERRNINEKNFRPNKKQRRRMEKRILKLRRAKVSWFKTFGEFKQFFFLVISSLPFAKSQPSQFSVVFPCCCFLSDEFISISWKLDWVVCGTQFIPRFLPKKIYVFMLAIRCHPFIFRKQENVRKLKMFLFFFFGWLLTRFNNAI